MRNPADLILNLDAAAAWRESLRPEKRRLVVTNGCFDILHYGHVEYLRQSRLFGDALLVALNADSSIRALKGPNRPVNGERQRAYVLAALAMVDAVVIFDTPRCDGLLRRLAPDIYVKGGDYSFDTIDRGERDALVATGAEIRFVPLVPGFSTTGTLEKIAAGD